MTQKVWIIDDPGLQGAARKGCWDEQPASRKLEETSSLSRPLQKSPALAFSLSLLAWGSGQLYLREYRSGSMFMAAMLGFYGGAAAIGSMRATVTRFAADGAIPESTLVVGGMIFFLVGLICWLVNVVDAYSRARRSRSESFAGVNRKYLPLFCSLLFPGWGQFLNAQPRKGLCFLLFGGMGIFSLFVLYVANQAWPVIQTSRFVSIFEISLITAFWLLPLSFLMWIVSAYDSFGARRLLGRGPQRFGYSGSGVARRRAERKLIPRSTAILALLLAISIGMQCIPKKYYLDSLGQLRNKSLQCHMEIIPGLIDKAMKFVDR